MEVHRRDPAALRRDVRDPTFGDVDWPRGQRQGARVTDVCRDQRLFRGEDLGRLSILQRNGLRLRDFANVDRNLLALRDVKLATLDPELVFRQLTEAFTRHVEQQEDRSPCISFTSARQRARNDALLSSGGDDGAVLVLSVRFVRQYEWLGLAEEGCGAFEDEHGRRWLYVPGRPMLQDEVLHSTEQLPNAGEQKYVLLDDLPAEEVVLEFLHCPVIERSPASNG